ATSGAQPLVVTNTGSSALTISSATVVAGTSDFAAVGTAGAQIIAPGATASWSLTCTPQAQGARPGTFRIVSDASTSATLDVLLTCTGERGFLASDPAAFNFNGVMINTVASTTVTLRNTGNLSVTGITAALLPANAGYTVDAATVPATLAAGASAAVTVRFSPTPTADGGPATVTFAGVWGTATNPTSAVLELDGDGLTAGFNVSPAAIAFGDLRYDTTPTRTFCITNTDQAAIQIQSITVIPGASTASNEFAIASVVRQPTCGTAGTAVVLPHPLAQNEILQVTVRAQPANRVGPLTAELRVTSNLVTNPTRSVTVTGNATTAMLTLVPGTTVDFGIVDIQTAGTTSMITLRNTGTAPLELAGFQRTVGPAFVLSLPAATQLLPGQALVIPVTYAPTVARAAGSEETVTLSHSIDGDIALPATGTIVLRGRGVDRDMVLGPTPAFPDTFRNPGTLGPVRLIAVTNPGEAPLRIAAAMVSNDAEVWKLLDTDPVDIPAGATFEFRVRFEPKLAGPAPPARLQLTNDDDDDGPPITTKITEVELTGMGRDRNVAFNPGAIDLGYVELGETVTLPDALVVTSMDAEHAFTIQTISFEGEAGGFAIEGAVDGVRLEPTAERRFTMTFTPDTAGAFTARARLFLDEDPEHQAEVEVRGTAVFVDARGGGGCSTGGDAGGLAAPL
ncbi:MAG: choice-of-anchor D domain-containing protein, partial [Deltaproteobacteria bacterium]|nr:choice-of-anchor D domain-containing protein [Deltaproteobacteria bacterium]